MESNQFAELAGTSWTLTNKGTELGVLTFDKSTSGTYKPQGESSNPCYWWQNENSFWVKQANAGSEYLSILEGEISSGNAGRGRIVVGQDQSGTIVVEPFTMSLNTTR